MDAKEIVDLIEEQFTGANWTGGGYKDSLDGDWYIELDGTLNVSELVRRLEQKRAG